MVVAISRSDDTKGKRTRVPEARLAVAALVLVLLVPGGQAILPANEDLIVPTGAGASFETAPVAGHSTYYGQSGPVSVQEDSGEGGSQDMVAPPSTRSNKGETDGDGYGNFRDIQRECAAWFNGMNVDQRIHGASHTFPGDDWAPGMDAARQDYSFARDVPDCKPFTQELGGSGSSVTSLGLPTDFAVVAGRAQGAGFAVAVERGDCDPLGDGENFRYRGHLDFVDPNGLYHEVQEYDYTCPDSYAPGRTLSVPVGPVEYQPVTGPGVAQLGHAIGPLVQQLYPWSNQDPHNQVGCDVVQNDDALEGNKCSGSIQDLFTERLWITPVHMAVLDPTIQRVYDHALQIDTCAGVNLYELDGKKAMGVENDYAAGHQMPEGNGSNLLQVYHEVGYHTYARLDLDDFYGHWPLQDVCTDGSSFSLNDTPRGRHVHSGPPMGWGDPEIMQGNSYNFDPNSETLGKHRTNCRVEGMNWPMNTYPPGPPPIAHDCYPEDHKSALVDLYAYESDPTGLWDTYANGNTGPAAYRGPGVSTGPDGEPDPY